MPSQTPPVLKSFQCKSCGGTIDLRAPGKTQYVACQFCGSIINAQDPNLALIEKFKGKLIHKPAIPLGRRGKIRGEEYEMIGYLRRTVTIEGTDYTWEEYLLYHPYRGYRWLAQYGGHWNFIKSCTGMPKVSGTTASYLNMSFRKFQEAEARVTYVVGEFFWEIRRGEKAETTDYIQPPFILSSEKTGNEVTWSIGEYIKPEDIWKGFALEGAPSAQVGVGPSQPSPYEIIRRPMRWTFWILLSLLLISHVGCLILCRNEKVHSESFPYSKDEPEHARVSQVFELKGRTSNVEITTLGTWLTNQYAEVEMALLNEGTGEAYDLTREVSHYSGVATGVDEDGHWSENWVEDDLKDTALIPSVPPGRYYLWVHPKTASDRFSCVIEVRRDVPRWAPFFLALPLILLPYWFYLWRRRSYEVRRWAESDYPMPSLVQLPSGGSDDDE